jgi:hypothetical protein
MRPNCRCCGMAHRNKGPTQAGATVFREVSAVEGRPIDYGWLKNGDRLTDVVFIDYYHSKLMLGMDGEFDEQSGEMLVGDVGWVKLSKVMSIEVQ